MSGLRLNFNPIEPVISLGEDATFGETYDAARTLERYDELTAETRFDREVYDPFSSFYNSVVRPMDPDFFDHRIEGSARHGETRSPISLELRDRIEDANGFPDMETLDEFLTQVRAAGLEPPEDLTVESIEQRRAEAEAAAQEEYLGAQNVVSRGPMAGMLAGYVVGGMDNFETLATLPISLGARAGILATAALEGGLTAATEIATTGERNEFLRELGLPEQSMLENALVGGITGGILGGGLRGIEVGASRLGRLLGQRQMRQLAEAAVQSEDPGLSAMGQALLQDLEQAGQAGGNVSRVAEEEHQRRLTEATRILNEGGEGGLTDLPATLRPLPDQPGGALEAVSIRDLQTDTARRSARFDEAFDPERAGVVTIFEGADGSRTVVDGRARVAAAADAGLDGVAARVYREEDGFAIEDLRAVADEMEGAELEVMPRVINDLQRLSEDALNIVALGGIDGGVALAVARALDDTSLHYPMIRALQRAGVTSIEEAEQAIPQIAPTLAAEAPDTSMAARAKVVDRAFTDMENDDELLELLRQQDNVANGRDPDAPGSAEQDAQLMRTLRDVITAQQERNPALRRAINEAARHYSATGRLGDGGARLLSAVRDLQGTGALDGTGARAGGRSAEPESPASPAPDGAERFSDPVDGEGAAGQVASTPLLRDPPPEGFSDDVAGRQDLKRRIEDGASREELDNHPTVIAAVEDMNARAERATDLDTTYNTREWHIAREYVFGDEVEVGTRAAIPRWREQAESFAGPEGPRRQREVTILLGPPAAGKSTIAEELATAQRAAILDPDEIKATLPEYEGGIGAAAVHEESSDLTKMLEGVMRTEGTNMIVPKVGGSPGSIRKLADRFRGSGYTVRVVNMAVSADEAYVRMMGRFVDKGRIIPPRYMDEIGENPSATYRTLKQEGIADGYAEIDNNGPFKAPKPITDRAGQSNPLAGSRFDLPEGGGDLRRGLDADPARGDRGTGTQDVIRRDALADRVAIGVEQVELGQRRAMTMTREELEADLKADETFAEVIQYCVR